MGHSVGAVQPGDAFHSVQLQNPTQVDEAVEALTAAGLEVNARIGAMFTVSAAMTAEDLAHEIELTLGVTIGWESRGQGYILGPKGDPADCERMSLALEPRWVTIDGQPVATTAYATIEEYFTHDGPLGRFAELSHERLGIIPRTTILPPGLEDQS